MNKGVLALNENFKTWNKTLIEADHKSTDYADALNQANTALADLTGALDATTIPLDFLDDTTKSGAKHLKLLEKAAEGDADAINELGVELAYTQLAALDFRDTITGFKDADGN